MATEIDFVDTPIEARVQKEVHANCVLSGNEKLKLTVGDKKLNVNVPNGKVWTIRAQILVDETDE